MPANPPWIDPYVPRSDILDAFDRDGGWNRKYIGDIEITVTAANGDKTVIPVPLTTGGNPRSVEVTAGIVELENDGRKARVHPKFTLHQLQDLVRDAGLPSRWFYEISGEPLECFDGDHIPSSKVIKRSVCLICSTSLKMAECKECGIPQWFEVGGRKDGTVHLCDGAPHHNFRN